MNRTLLGRYHIREVIGAGGMGTVYSADDEVLGRRVAIKALKEEYASDEATAERFRREARIAASLSHHGIAQVYDFAEEDGQAFIIMELLDGTDLHRSLHAQGKLDPALAASLVAQAADALHHAHVAGAVHRDIKPANIFLTSSGGVKVTDFGIARAADLAPVTRTGDVVGTPFYLAPELMDGHDSTPQSDIYSLGCVLFQLITGRAPFAGEQPLAVAMAHKTDPVPDLLTAEPAAPASLADIVTKSLAKDPADRFDDALQMGDALRSISPEGTADATSTLASPATLVLPKDAERTHASSRGTRSRRPAIAVGILASIIFLIVAMAMALRSDGAEVPDLVGMRFAEAKAELEDRGLRVERQVAVGIETRETVIGQDPPQGTSLSQDAVVRVTVSDGTGVRVPAVKGATLNEAERILRAAGFTPKVIGEVRSDDPGKVVDQTPAAGVPSAPGSTVGLTISAEPDERRGRGKGKDD